MLTIRRSQMALLGAAMFERFIDEEHQRLAAAGLAAAGASGREQVRLAVLAARDDGLHSVAEVRARLDDSFSAPNAPNALNALKPQAGAG